MAAHSLLFCCCSGTKSCPTLWHPIDCILQGFSVLHYLPEFAQSHVNWVGDAIQPSHPLLSPSSPALSGSFPVSQIVTSSGQSIWSFSFSISPSNEYSGLISFRIDWFDLLTIQGTLKSLFQHHNSKASILHHSAFFMFQVSHPYMTNGKTIALTRWTLAGKVMSLLLNMLSRLPHHIYI